MTTTEGRRDPFCTCRVCSPDPNPDLLIPPAEPASVDAVNGTDKVECRERIDYSRRITPELAAQLRSWRERGGWTRQDVADAAGISASYLGTLEAGKRAPSALVADALGFALELDAAEVAQLQAQAITDAGRMHPGRLDREARRPAARSARNIDQVRRDLLAVIGRERRGVAADIAAAVDRRLGAYDLAEYDQPAGDHHGAMRP